MQLQTVPKDLDPNQFSKPTLSLAIKSVAPKRILLLSVSAGAGHTRAAEALLTYIDLHEPGITAAHLDVMNFVPAGFRKLYTDFYIRLVNKHPAVWRYLYELTNDAQPDGLMQKLRRKVERLNTRALHKRIAAFQPDAIVCTHFLPAEILAHMVHSTHLACPVWVQVTDFDLHSMWVQPGMAGYFAANEEVAFRIGVHGISSDLVHVTGIPIMPAFSEGLDRRVCAAELGLKPERTTIMLMGGGAGLGTLEAIAARLLAMDADFQLIVLAGKNIDALVRLEHLAKQYPGRLVPRGFIQQVERLMACADLVITKPGGLTISECMAMTLPMIVNSPIPGQEERNANYLLEKGVALKAFDAVTLEYRVRYLLDHPAKLEEMRNRIQHLGRPHAARAVLDCVLQRACA